MINTRVQYIVGNHDKRWWILSKKNVKIDGEWKQVGCRTEFKDSKNKPVEWIRNKKIKQRKIILDFIKANDRTPS